jgi:hypothetical protein
MIGVTIMSRWTFIAALAGLGMTGLSAQTLELFVDTVTKQVYTEAGPNRERLGQFQRVDGAVATAGTVPGADPAAASSYFGGPQTATAPASVAASEVVLEPEERPLRWFEKMSFRGYTQLRGSEFLDDELNTYRHWADKSVAEDQSLVIRRARLIYSGNVTDRLFLYLQPDFAVTPPNSSQTHFVQLRDAYADVYLDEAKDWRIRVGQSKIPFGFENLQSSSNRLALDRNDAFNSCCKDERDIGAFVYWTPEGTRALFREIADLGLKHSGDYGLFGVGIYNGQGANRPDSNGEFHWVARASYPWRFANGQVFEAGVQALQGNFLPSVNDPALLAGAPGAGFKDERFGVSAIWYPQPFGLQAEWNWGDGPALSLDQSAIGVDSLDGGYVQAMYRLETEHGIMMPFIRWQRFQGAMKFELNAPRADVTETELGFEWQVRPELELTTMYVMTDRTNVLVSPYEQLTGDLLRMQLQWNY